jgi:bifunctional DNA-binding transcriptional regulator/antitoxin component of YhaV-PrlF toxin-antitoxin module
MKLQKHYTRKDKSQWKFEVVIPKESIEEAGFNEGDELEAKAKKGEIRLKKKNGAHIRY